MNKNPKIKFIKKRWGQMRVIALVGARPNFMKIAPIIKAFEKVNVRPLLVHSGQHYDYKMSEIFFKDLDIPEPDIHLEIGSGSHGEQTGKVLIQFEQVIEKYQPEAVVVVGDVNTTLAGALAAVKLGVPVAHIEAGLRSFDRTMPEEINRILTDQISDFLFIHSPEARENLIREGVNRKKIFDVGNVMIDTLLTHKDKAVQKDIIDKLGVQAKKYALLTLHRPSNVDDIKVLSGILEAVEKIQQKIKIIFPIHPRTRAQLERRGIKGKIKKMKNIIFTEPQGYLDFLHLNLNAGLVLTDSGGIQEETTVLKVPCLTLRESTERPITITKGTNQLVGIMPQNIIKAVDNVLDGFFKSKGRPSKWDGRSSQRIVGILMKKLK